jgi:hypothetical protein
MSFNLAPHPIGIKFWTSLWKENKHLSSAELHVKLSDWLSHATHRQFGRYFYLHRAGPLGAVAFFVVAGAGVKLGAMAYGSSRDRAAAIDSSAAYGMGGHMLAAVPK